VRGNPVRSSGDRRRCRFQSACRRLVIGLGGGAALDVAKVIALMSNHAGDVLEYAWGSSASPPDQGELPCFVALPTTAGTGSEVGRSSVISLMRNAYQEDYFFVEAAARAVFADPELTLDLPAHVTAATGMDALTHNVESYIRRGYHPMCDGIALEGVRIAALHCRSQ
jgi:alcohol dehydrogenase class IV